MSSVRGSTAQLVRVSRSAETVLKVGLEFSHLLFQRCTSRRTCFPWKTHVTRGKCLFFPVSNANLVVTLCSCFFSVLGEDSTGHQTPPCAVIHLTSGTSEQKQRTDLHEVLIGTLVNVCESFERSFRYTNKKNCQKTSADAINTTQSASGVIT